MNLKRLREWKAVLLSEGYEVSWWTMFRIGIKVWNWRSRGETLGLLKQCNRCLLNNRKLHQCRPWKGSNLGCGCHTPTLIRFGGECWAVETNQVEDQVGWNHKNKVTI
jgi:hypothetical protein